MLLLKYRYHRYEESFLELEIDHVSNMKASILDTERQIKELGGKNANQWTS
jgi:uncharacterized membrane protein